MKRILFCFLLISLCRTVVSAVPLSIRMSMLNGNELKYYEPAILECTITNSSTSPIGIQDQSYIYMSGDVTLYLRCPNGNIYKVLQSTHADDVIDAIRQSSLPPGSSIHLWFTAFAIMLQCDGDWPGRGRDRPCGRPPAQIRA